MLTNTIYDYGHQPSMDYVDLLNFNYPPFSCQSERELDNFYCAPHFSKVLDLLLQPSEQDRCLFKISAKEGSGKTLLIKKLISLADDKFRISLVSATQGINEIQLILKIFEGFKIEGTCKNQTEQLDNIFDHLKGLSDQSVVSVLIIDDAHNLGDISLKFIKKLIARLKEAIGSSFFKIVLVGENKNGQQKKLIALDNRLTRIELPHFSVQQTEKYIRHRLKKAGNSLDHLFKRALIIRIHKKTGGVPALINELAHEYLIKEAKLRKLQDYKSFCPENKIEPAVRKAEIQKLEESQKLSTVFTICFIAFVFMSYEKADDLLVPSELEKTHTSFSIKTLNFSAGINIDIPEVNAPNSKPSDTLNSDLKKIMNKYSTNFENLVLKNNSE